MRYTRSMRYALALTISFVFPLLVQAAGPTYTAIQDVRDTMFTLRVQTLGEESQAACSIMTRTCSLIDESFMLATSTPPNPLSDDVYAALPSGATWLKRSADDHYVAYYIPTTAKQSTRTFGVLDTYTSKTYETKEKHISYWDLLSEGVRMFAFSPDGTKLLYLSDKAGPQTLYQVDLTSLSKKGFVSKRIILRNYMVMDFGWLDDNTIYFSANREHAYAWNLYSFALGSDAPTLLAKNISYASTIKRVGDGLLFITIDGTTALPKIYTVPTKTLASFTLSWVTSAPAPQAEVVKSGGLTGAYWPAASATSTLVVWLHGGPYRQTALGYHSYFSYAGYDWALSELVESGVPVLRLDYPGSMGYGRPFAESLRLHLGTKDVADTSKAVAAFAKARGFKNVYVVGNSYGGYLAAKLLVEKPTQFKGAMPIAAVWDWEWLNTNLQTSIFNVQFDGLPNEKNQKLYDVSAIFGGMEKLTTQKVVIVHGNSDTDVPYTQSKAAYDMLQFLGKDATLLTFTDEDHIFSKKDSFVTLCQTLLMFAGAPLPGRCVL